MAQPKGEVLIPVEVAGLVQTDLYSFALTLKEQEGERAMLVWIGFAEGGAIARGLQKVTMERPDTYELLSEVLRASNNRLEQVIISDLKDSTYYAQMFLRRTRSTEPTILDSRPSDAIALALRWRAPVLVKEWILKHGYQEFERMRQEAEELKGKIVQDDKIEA